MYTQAYFENIQDQIKRELLKANHSIIVVLAWFTDKELYEILCDKAKSKLSVSVLISNDPINKGAMGLDFNILNNLGGEFVVIEEYGKKRMMHNKFCIIDNDTVITGSYNWTRRAQSNDENIVITKGSKELANEFLLTFLELKKKQSGKTNFKFDLTQICKRLELLKKTISIQDKEDIYYQLNRLKKLLDSPIRNTSFNTLFRIVEVLEDDQYSAAILLIDSFLKEFSSVTIYIDPELAALTLEIKSLELQISSLQDEKSEIEKKIFAFVIKYNLELGNIISKILDMKRKISGNKLDHEPNNETFYNEYKEANQDYDNYTKSANLLKTDEIIELSSDHQSELKSKFRRASKLCHPDVVADVYKNEAEKLFNELRNAFSKNDLETINTILDYLEKGKPFKAKHEAITAKDLLMKESNKLRRLLTQLIKEINEIKSSDTFNTVALITNIDDYFLQIKKKLIKELDYLNNEYENG